MSAPEEIRSLVKTGDILGAQKLILRELTKPGAPSYIRLGPTEQIVRDELPWSTVRWGPGR